MVLRTNKMNRMVQDDWVENDLLFIRINSTFLKVIHNQTTDYKSSIAPANNIPEIKS